MKIFTVWEAGDDEDVMPWLVAACDEYTVEEHNGMPDFYTDELRESRRELVIEIPESAVRKLFAPPVVKGEVK